MNKQTIDSHCGSSEDKETAFERLQLTFKILSGKWTLSILWRLHEGTKRFGELQRSLPGVTQHMLTASLRELEKEGLVAREVFAQVPPRVEYSLTEKGHSLSTIFGAMLQWSSENNPRPA